MVDHEQSRKNWVQIGLGAALALLLLLFGIESSRVAPLSPLLGANAATVAPGERELASLTKAGTVPEPTELFRPDSERKVIQQPKPAIEGQLLPPAGAILQAGVQVAALPSHLAGDLTPSACLRQLQYLRATTQLADAEGRFRIEGLDPDKRYVLRAISEDFFGLPSKGFRMGETAEVQLGYLFGLELRFEDQAKRMMPEVLAQGITMALTTETRSATLLAPPRGDVYAHWLEPDAANRGSRFVLASGTGDRVPPLNWLLRSPWFGSVTSTEQILGRRSGGRFPQSLSTLEVQEEIGVLSLLRSKEGMAEPRTATSFLGMLAVRNLENQSVQEFSLREGEPVLLKRGRYELSFRDPGSSGPWILDPPALYLQPGTFERVTVTPPDDWIGTRQPSSFTSWSELEELRKPTKVR